jgi:phosphate starvation-inducible PhoH-like protein
MRGRTLNDSFVILDEAQNTTCEQMKMFVTRLGFNSKAVITGDITQIDLPNARRSGLLEAIDVLKSVNGLAFVHFDESDVVRHHLVQRIVRAYDEHRTRTGEQQQMMLLAEPRVSEPRRAEPRAAEPRPAESRSVENGFAGNRIGDPGSVDLSSPETPAASEKASRYRERTEEGYYG